MGAGAWKPPSELKLRPLGPHGFNGLSGCRLGDRWVGLLAGELHSCGLPGTGARPTLFKTSYWFAAGLLSKPPLGTVGASVTPRVWQFWAGHRGLNQPSAAYCPLVASGLYSYFLFFYIKIIYYFPFIGSLPATLYNVFLVASGFIMYIFNLLQPTSSNITLLYVYLRALK